MADFTNLISASSLDLDEIREWLDTASPVERLAAVRGISGKQQALLFSATEGRPGLTLSSIVPSDTDPLVEVIHHGRNSLPMFNDFQKRFARTSEDGVLVGYNEQSMRWATGPGYFIAREEGAEIAIDYRQLPDVKVDSWPEIISQSAKLGRLVYFGMVDMLRPVSSHVTVGRAWKGGKVTNNYFLLCRDGA
ncbi:MAG: hypothetical protein VX223_10420 [Myxococcota bacterium]|nr:hypothetical protein [Myxococcota bacterium]